LSERGSLLFPVPFPLSLLSASCLPSLLPQPLRRKLLKRLTIRRHNSVHHLAPQSVRHSGHGIHLEGAAQLPRLKVIHHRAPTPILAAISANGTPSAFRTARSSPFVGFLSFPACRKGRSSLSSLRLSRNLSRSPYSASLRFQLTSSLAGSTLILCKCKNTSSKWCFLQLYNGIL